MDETTIEPRFNAREKMLLLMIEGRGLHATAFIHNVQQARMLLINLGAAVREWEQAIGEVER